MRLDRAPSRRQPAGGVRRGAALDERHPAGHVRAALEGPLGAQDDVEHQVAQDDDARARRARPPDAAGAGARDDAGEHVSQGRHARRIARRRATPRLQWTAEPRPTAADRWEPCHDHRHDLDQLAIDTIRTLSIDAVQKANSGHPGAPMGAAPMAYVLWTRFLRHAPTHPDWPDRDRFVLSRRARQHAAVLAPPPDRLRPSRSRTSSRSASGARVTPGHPEYGLTPGVEATTGPLGQGFANAVGMAIAERRLAAEFNRPGHAIVDHRTYVIASDGDLQEGIASEAASLAGHLRLGKLIVLYDDNHIQLDGPTAMAWSEDVPRASTPTAGTPSASPTATTSPRSRPRSRPRDADDRPSLIAVRTHIGFGSPNKQDTPEGARRRRSGPDEVRLTKEAYGWDPDRTFYVPDEAREHFRAAIPAGEALVADWEARFDALRDAAPGRAAAEFRRRDRPRRLPDGWDADLKTYETGDEVATRNASQDAIQALAGRGCPSCSAAPRTCPNRT